MNGLKRNLENIWSQLRGQKPGRANSLEEIHLKGLRGIKDLRIPFSFPVTVLAGPNGSGKSTFLFALACAYSKKGEDRQYTPAALFPDFKPRKTTKEAQLSDERSQVEIVFSYIAENERLSMKWARGKGKWNRSFFGRKKVSQPQRALYLRTLANLSNPSEVRSVLQLAYRDYQTETVDAANIAFAQRILGCRYDRLSIISDGLKNVLFAQREKDEDNPEVRYSEFHMSAGERAVLRLSIGISKMNDALVLIDEIEAGLHPYIQQLLMLELQRLALRNQLQVVVTTHSPVILDTVPADAQVFLERIGDTVVRRDPYRDIFQKALYGRSQDTLSIICEDEAAEALIRGVLDYLGPKIDFLQNDIRIGRDTGKDQFISHLETLGKFKKLDDVLFIFDGDVRSDNKGPRMEARAKEMGQTVKILYLPGYDSPEAWSWRILQDKTDNYAPLLGLTPENLKKQIHSLDNLYAHAVGKPAEISKNKFITFAEQNARQVNGIIREIGKTEASTQSGEIHEFVNQLEDSIRGWRSLKQVMSNNV